MAMMEIVELELDNPVVAHGGGDKAGNWDMRER